MNVSEMEAAAAKLGVVGITIKRKHRIWRVRLETKRVSMSGEGSDIGAAFTVALLRLQRTMDGYEKMKSSRGEEFSQLLGWLQGNDPDGLWGEYVEDYDAAADEHGELDLESLREVVAEMKE